MQRRRYSHILAQRRRLATRYGDSDKIPSDADARCEEFNGYGGPRRVGTSASVDPR